MNRRKLIIGAATSMLGIGTLAFYWPNRWSYIVVHHSAGTYGNIEFLQKVHRQRQAKDPIDAIPYHYVIGNGKGMTLGEVRSDWRQGKNIWGAHLSGDNIKRNFLGLGICLIGNFEQHVVPQEQFDALVRLTQDLMSRYAIDASRVTGHGRTRGEQTKCPGKYFPMQSFLQAIS